MAPRFAGPRFAVPRRAARTIWVKSGDLAGCCSFHPVASQLSEKQQAAGNALHRLRPVSGPFEPAPREPATRDCYALTPSGLTVTGSRNGIIARSLTPTCSSTWVCSLARVSVNCGRPCSFSVIHAFAKLPS